MKLWFFAAGAALFLFAVGALMVRNNRLPEPLVPGAMPAPGMLGAAPPPLHIAPPPGAVPPPPAAAPEDAGPMTVAAFRQLAQEVSDQLPVMNDVGLMHTDDSFQAPPPAVKAAPGLMRLAKAVHGNPELVDAAIVVYRECGSSNERPLSVRALCLMYFRRLSRRSAKPTPEGFAPPEVRTLADQMSR